MQVSAWLAGVTCEGLEMWDKAELPGGGGAVKARAGKAQIPETGIVPSGGQMAPLPPFLIYKMGHWLIVFTQRAGQRELGFK